MGGKRYKLEVDSGCKKHGVKKNEGEDRDRLEINKAALSAALFIGYLN